MRAVHIVKIAGLHDSAVAEAYRRLRAVLGDLVTGGVTPRWGAGEGGAWLNTETFKVVLSFFGEREDLKRPSRFEVYYFGEMTDDVRQQIVAALQTPPLPTAAK